MSALEIKPLLFFLAARSLSTTAFKVQEESLRIKPASKTRKRTVGANGAMAGNDNGYGIASIGGADGARSVGAASVDIRRARVAARAAVVAFSASPASAASRNRRTCVRSADLTALLR